MSDNEISFHIRLTYIVGSMSRNMRRVFLAMLIQMWNKCHSNVTSLRKMALTKGAAVTAASLLQAPSSSLDPTIDIPRNTNVIRRRYISGKNSIIANIPIPPPYIMHEHAVVRFIEVLTYLLGILSPELQPLNFGSLPSNGVWSPK